MRDGLSGSSEEIMLHKWRILCTVFTILLNASRRHGESFAIQLKWAISYQGKLSLLLSADGANILQSNFTYEKHLCYLVMMPVLHDGAFYQDILFQLVEGKIGTF